MPTTECELGDDMEGASWVPGVVSRASSSSVAIDRPHTRFVCSCELGRERFEFCDYPRRKFGSGRGGERIEWEMALFCEVVRVGGLGYGGGDAVVAVDAAHRTEPGHGHDDRESCILRCGITIHMASSP